MSAGFPALTFTQPDTEDTDEGVENKSLTGTKVEEDVLNVLLEDVMATVQEAVEVVEPYLSAKAMSWYDLLREIYAAQFSCCLTMPCERLVPDSSLVVSTTVFRRGSMTIQ